MVRDAKLMNPSASSNFPGTEARLWLSQRSMLHSRYRMVHHSHQRALDGLTARQTVGPSDCTILFVTMGELLKLLASNCKDAKSVRDNRSTCPAHLVIVPYEPNHQPIAQPLVCGISLLSLYAAYTFFAEPFGLAACQRLAVPRSFARTAPSSLGRHSCSPPSAHAHSRPSPRLPLHTHDHSTCIHGIWPVLQVYAAL